MDVFDDVLRNFRDDNRVRAENASFSMDSMELEWRDWLGGRFEMVRLCVAGVLLFQQFQGLETRECVGLYGCDGVVVQVIFCKHRVLGVVVSEMAGLLVV